MIPNFNLSGVLPPFDGSDPAVGLPSPYDTTLTEIHAKLGYSPERIELIQGLIDYRSALRAVGIFTGFQLIDGSFTEQCEISRGRPPADIDLVTYAYLPVHGIDVAPFINSNLALFDQSQTKANFKCDAYFVDLSKDTRLVVEDTCYWYGLFSHQRSTALWKGMLKLPLQSDDAAVLAALAANGGNP
ncbi:hypothetical protein [Collimonas sp. OK607]|uniref:DUF6932 family protein n=1 Tax=Collimonas sp. OK607 TaxID=1798194 RepID=UPI000B89CAF0|nr:hypothetical protein [Collimonas sp. OK607]